MKSKEEITHCKDMLLKIFSLCLGTLIWFFVVGADQMDMNITIPIEVLNLPDNLVIYNQYQKELNVTLRGPRSIMQDMRSRNLSLPVDLSGAKPDTIVVNTDLPLPSGISILRMQPANITLSIDQLVQKHIPITAVTEGKAASGYVLKEVILNPNKILVSGPKQLLDREQSLKTYPINISGFDHPTTLPVHLELSQDIMNLIGATTVVAKMVVKEKFIEKIIHNIPIKVKGAAEPVTVNPDVVSVFAHIPEQLLVERAVPTTLFTVSVDASGSGELPRKVPVDIKGVSVAGHEPIVIKSFTPTEVEILPEKQSGEHTSP